SSKYFREYLDRTKGATSPDIMFRIADARQRAGDIDGAIEGFKEAALENNEMGQIASFYLGHLYVKSDRKNLALAAYKSAMDATYDKTIQEDAHFNYAKVAYDLGHYGEAITAMNTYLSKYPQSART